MSDYIYHGTLHIKNKSIEASWTTGFDTIWVDGKEYNGYHELLERIGG